MTAEEYYKKWENTAKTIPDIMIEFAELHVRAALLYASDFKNHPDSFCEGYVWWIPSDSIINCYPKELIK